MANLHAVFPTTIPYGYFSTENITFIQQKIKKVLAREFTPVPNIDTGSVVRVLQRVIDERLESIPKMNQRTIMYICNEYRNHQVDATKHLNWEENYWKSQMIYDDSVGRGPDIMYGYNFNTKRGTGIGTHRFYFT